VFLASLLILSYPVNGFQHCSLFYQVFFAHLAMATLSTNNLPPFLHDSNDHLSVPIAIAFHSITLLVQDWKDLINAHVKSSISNQIRSDQQHISKYGKARQAALKEWNKSDSPFSWAAANLNHAGSYVHLLILLKEDHRSRPSELQKSPESYTYIQLAKRLCNISAMLNPVAPVSLSGSFFTALPLAIKRIRSTLPLSGSTDPGSYVISIYAKVLKKMNIHFIPWHKCEMRVVNRAYAVQPDWWMMLKACPMAEMEKTLPKEPQDAHAELANHIMNTDPNAPWSLPPHLDDMGTLWDKYTLPSDWSLDAASLPSSPPGHPNYYVRETYEYVENNYNGRIWWHHLALVWGILFSKITPFVFGPKNPALGSRDLDREIRALPWSKTTSQNHGGCSNPVPFITMISTTIFALLDSASPLSVRAAQNKNAFGNAWTSKHGVSSSHDFMQALINYYYLFRE
jgi:hypothetical protein